MNFGKKKEYDHESVPKAWGWRKTPWGGRKLGADPREVSFPWAAWAAWLFSSLSLVVFSTLHLLWK